MMRLVPLFGAAFATAALALAQGGPGDVADLQRLQRELLENRSEVQRLIELRLRHGLGQPLESGGVAHGVTGLTLDQLVCEQREQEDRTSALREQCDKLRAAVEQRRAGALLQPGSEGCERELLDMPAAAPELPAVLPAGPPAGPPPGPSAAPVVAPPHAPQGAQIRGSSDPLRVARALLRAGQALMDRATQAREQGNSTLAAELDKQAAQRLQQAIEELAPVVKSEGSFGALFTQGQCRELLFRYSERYEGLSLAGSTREYQLREQEVREPFLAIAARDVARTGARQEVEVLGPWGMAAQSAMEHFRWMNLHSGYSRRTAIEALTWPGERDQ
ncbi:MAG TPA: hypothetical protein VFD82_17285 [Planctomycetota bacterium]|nr:hypothetical protein [Planctomycetota bacterium]